MKIRIIPTILFSQNSVVKGKNFESWRVCGSIKQTIKIYSLREVDELIFFDIHANKNGINLKLIDDFADECFMPITIGGGIKNLSDIENLLKVGADRVCVNTQAFLNQKLIKDAIKYFGSQCIVVSVDYKVIENKKKVFIECGKKNTNCDLENYLKILEDIGPSEIVLNSIDHDGLLNGYDKKTLVDIKNKFNIKVIASGGANKEDEIIYLNKVANINAFSMSSIFIFTENTPQTIKKYLYSKGLDVRID